MVKNPPEMQETWVRPLGWEDPLEEGMATALVFFPRKSQWGHKESDMTEKLSIAQHIWWHKVPINIGMYIHMG